MNKLAFSTLATVAFLSSLNPIRAAVAFDAGSNGSYGALNVAADTNLPLPPDGIFHCTTINIAAGAKLTFTKNALNTPVYLLAQGDVVIDGKIDVSGKAAASPYAGGISGPGGFDGGSAGYTGGDASTPGGDGFGPGGGKHGNNSPGAGGAGGASYAVLTIQRTSYNNPNGGDVYGSSTLIPLLGGSGAAGIDGNPSGGGGGGGGAILIASNTKITVNSTAFIVSNGGGPGGSYNFGSGGAIRLLAPRVFGNGTLDVSAGSWGGAGRIRIDSIYKYEPTDPANFNLSLKTPGTTAAVGSTLITFPPNQPRLDLIAAAGTSIAEGPPNSVLVQLPFGSNPAQAIIVQARSFNAKVPIRVVLTPQSGDSIGYDAEIDNTTANPATATVNATFPINQLVRVTAWTK